MLSHVIICFYMITKIISWNTVSLPRHEPIKHGRLTCPRSSRNPQEACSEPPQVRAEEFWTCFGCFFVKYVGSILEDMSP